MTIKDKLLTIQTKLKAHKGQLNKFGGYNYRSLEDIYEAVKPLLAETKTVLTIDDDLEVVNNIIFRKSTATLHDTESDEAIKTHTFTQESLERKGMSSEQCSGSVSSYGSKYCLNKLFCIDDTKDADTNEIQSVEPKGREPTKVTPKVDPPKEDKPVEVKKEEPPARRRVPVPTTETKPEPKKEEVKKETKPDEDQW